MICAPCREAGQANQAGDGFDAVDNHAFCDNYMLHPESTPTWCDCGHVVTASDPFTCRNCDGRKCMDCVGRIVHEWCADDCPDCCDPLYAMEPMADWEKELLEREY